MRRHLSKVKPAKGARQALLRFGRNPTRKGGSKRGTAKSAQPTPASPPRYVQRRSSKVPHATRPEIDGSAHVVLRIRRGLPWLRTPRTYRVLERALRAGRSKLGFRLIHYSVQRDHLHMVVETDDRRRLARAMQGLMIRIAKNLNRFWRRRSGPVFADRYFALAITSWRQALRTVRYVLCNARKHGDWSATDRPDPFSSGPWFHQWYEHDFRRPLRRPPVLGATRHELTTLPGFSLDYLPSPRWAEHGSLADLLAT